MMQDTLNEYTVAGNTIVNCMRLMDKSPPVAFATEDRSGARMLGQHLE
ncbi:hypothetical protein ABAC402_00295 [Asticcacaulis sp. AC402]|nr:hypothetical protein ABAC402_00295 [Asticcacaulis sp. AC402]